MEAGAGQGSDTQGGGEERGGAEDESDSTEIGSSMQGSTEKLQKSRPKISELQNAKHKRTLNCSLKKKKLKHSQGYVTGT